MPAPLAPQVARIAALYEGLHEDIAELRGDRRDFHVRLRALEDTVRVMTDRHEVAELRHERSQRRIEIRLQALTVVIGAAAFLMPVMISLIYK